LFGQIRIFNEDSAAVPPPRGCNFRKHGIVFPNPEGSPSPAGFGPNVFPGRESFNEKPENPPTRYNFPPPSKLWDYDRFSPHLPPRYAWQISQQIPPAAQWPRNTVMVPARTGHHVTRVPPFVIPSHVWARGIGPPNWQLGVFFPICLYKSKCKSCVLVPSPNIQFFFFLAPPSPPVCRTRSRHYQIHIGRGAYCPWENQNKNVVTQPYRNGRI